MIDARTIPPCVVCRRVTCVDHRACRDELAAMCERTGHQTDAERLERQRDRSAA